MSGKTFGGFNDTVESTGGHHDREPCDRSAIVANQQVQLCEALGGHILSRLGNMSLHSEIDSPALINNSHHLALVKLPVQPRKRDFTTGFVQHEETTASAFLLVDVMARPKNDEKRDRGHAPEWRDFFGGSHVEPPGRNRRRDRNHCTQKHRNEGNRRWNNFDDVRRLMNLYPR